MRILRNALKLSAAVLIGLLLVLAIVFGAAQTAPGKRWVAASLAGLLSDASQRVTITDLSGLVPFDLHFGKIVIADAKGPRVTVEDATFAIAPGDLLRGQLMIKRLTARSIAVERSSESTSETDWSSLLHPPVSVTLTNLRIDRLSLGPALLGEPVTASVEASGTLAEGRLAGDLHVVRLDGTPGSVTAHAVLAGTPPWLEVTADVAEPSGRLLADVTHAAASLPLSLHLAGKGPLADWQGSLAMSAGAEARLDADFRIRGDGGYRLAVNGKTELAPLLPSALRPLLGAPTTFSATASIAGPKLALDALELRAPKATLSATGSLDQATRDVAGDATLVLPDLGALSPLLGGETHGAATARLALGGKLDDATARLSLSSQAPSLAGNGAAAAEATLDFHARGDALAAMTPIDIAGSGNITGVSLAGAALPGGLRNRLDWRLAAELDRAASSVKVSDLAFTDAGNTLTAEATGSAAGAEGQAHLEVPDLAALAGQVVQGSLALDTDFHAGADGAGIAVLHGAIRQPKSGTAMLDALLGSEATIEGTVERGADGTVSARELAVKGAALTLTGEARRGSDGRIAASYRLDLPRLAALGEGYGGSASLSGSAGGTVDALKATAELVADKVRAQAAQLDHLAATLDIDNLARPSGTLQASFRAAGIDGTATVQGALAPHQVLRFDRVHLEAARTRLDGALTLRLADQTIDGTLTGTAPDLRPWSALAGQPLAGSATLKASFAGAKGQSVDVTLDGKRLALGDSDSIATLHATARLADLFARPSGRAELRLDQAKLGSASLGQLRLVAATDRAGHFNLTGTSRGTIGEAFTLDTAATATIAQHAVELRITRLAGRLGKQPITLRRPLLLARRDQEMSVAGLDLVLGQGRLTGDGSIKGEALSAHLLARNLPLRSLAELGGQQNVSGALGAELTLSGTRRKPQGRLVVDGEQLRLAIANRPDLPPLGLVVSAVWRGDRVDFQGRLAGPNNAALGFTGAVPFELDAQNLAPHLPPSGAIALHLEGDGEVANFADLLPNEDRVSGRFTVNVSIAGTVAQPVASGRLSLRNGRYESLAAGTILTGLSFDLIGDRDRLLLMNFTASDGAKGSLGLTGAVSLVAPGGPAFAFNGELKSFRAMQLDQGTGTVSGNVQLTGNIVSPRLAANLRIDQADLRVPERLPQNVQPIAVTIVDSRTGQILSRPEQQQSSTALIVATLDVTIDMPGQVFVRGLGLDSEWRGKLTITGTTAEPNITGKLEVVRGTYNFIGKTATLNSGTITFVGGKRIDPDINIEAEVASSDVTAIIRIIGTAMQPKIQLTSQPELPQDEILARVLFGTSISQVSAAQGIQIAAAAASLATGGGPGVLDTIRQGLGLDRLSIGNASNNAFNNINVPSLNQPSGIPNTLTAGVGTSPAPLGATAGTSGATAVSAGKYVANGVYVGVTQGLTASSSSVDVQIDVTRNITLDTTTGQQTGSSVGLNWKLDY